MSRRTIAPNSEFSKDSVTAGRASSHSARAGGRPSASPCGPAQGADTIPGGSEGRWASRPFPGPYSNNPCSPRAHSRPQPGLTLAPSPTAARPGRARRRLQERARRAEEPGRARSRRPSSSSSARPLPRLFLPAASPLPVRSLRPAPSSLPGLWRPPSEQDLPGRRARAPGGTRAPGRVVAALRADT